MDLEPADQVARVLRSFSLACQEAARHWTPECALSQTMAMITDTDRRRDLVAFVEGKRIRAVRFDEKLANGFDLIFEDGSELELYAGRKILAWVSMTPEEIALREADDVEKKEASRSAGWYELRTISGKPYLYHRWRQGGRKHSRLATAEEKTAWLQRRSEAKPKTK
jgi:hypothetical protein